MRDKKSVLIVSASFYPMSTPRANRTTELVKEFARQGHDVTVLIPNKNYDYNDFKNKNKINIIFFKRSKFKSFQPKKLKLFRFFERFTYRILMLLFEYPDIGLMFNVNKVLKSMKSYDLVISVAVPYPIHWGVLWAYERTRICKVWVADCGDPYYGYGNSLFKKVFYLRMITNMVFKSCDFISVPFAGAIKAYPERFRSKIRIIPQGFNLSENIIKEQDVYYDIPNFAYAGAIIPGRRDPRPLIDYLIKHDYKYRFVIYTKQKELFGKYIDIIDSDLVLKDYVPRENLLIELSRMSFLINFNNGNDIQLPSKLIDYALTGRPILSLDSCNLNISILKEFLSGEYKGSFKVNIKEYDIKNIVKSFLELV